MKQHYLFIFILAFWVYGMSCTGSNSCSTKNYLCPAFSDSLFSAWFPYTTGQKIIFHYQTLYDTITIDSVSKSASYSTTARSTDPNPCMANISIYSAEVKDGNPVFDISEYVPVGSNSNINIQFKGWYSTTSRSGDSLFTPSYPNGEYYSVYYDSIALNGTTFNKVVMLGGTDTAGSTMPKPYKIYFQKGKGIIAYETYPLKQVWTLQ